jgi:hypothetical protein
MAEKPKKLELQNEFRVIFPAPKLTEARAQEKIREIFRSFADHRDTPETRGILKAELYRFINDHYQLPYVENVQIP